MEENRLSITLTTPKIFNFEECLWFLDRNYDDCLHQVGSQQVTKAVQGPEGPLLFRIQPEREALSVTVLQGTLSPLYQDFLEQYVSEYIDLETPLEEFYRLLSQEPALAYMTDAFYGLRMMGLPDLFEALVWCVIGQQINLTFAYRLKRRLVEAYGTSLQHQGSTYHLFPTPEALATATPEALRPLQFSGSKARYIIGLAHLFAEGHLSKASLKQLPDTQARLTRLLAIKGVGAWTANYVLMKSLRERTCIPYGDVGLINALKQHSIVPDKPAHRQVGACFEQFEGWQSYLVLYLWRSLAVPKH